MPGLNSFVNGSLFDVLVVPEGGIENNTLASYDSCYEDLLQSAYLGDLDLLFQYVPLYIGNATARLNQYTPDGFTFNNNDTYAMQSICAYEHAYIGMSDFCSLFTEDEWSAFEQTLDIEYYYDYSFGSPTGRAQGLGYQQELVARLTGQYIINSNSSVNSSLTNNPQDFPLERPFYVDFSHDDIIVSVLTSMSIDYFREHPDLSQYPPDPNRHFLLSHMTPFGARLITEVIGCAAPEPEPVHEHRTTYYPTQYGYDPTNAPHKFIRMRLNDGILPLDTIRGGFCEGRPDGLCAKDDFLASQYEAVKLANYDFACFANYTILDPTNGRDYDGTVNNGTKGIVVNDGRIDAEYIESLQRKRKRKNRKQKKVKNKDDVIFALSTQSAHTARSVKTPSLLQSHVLSMPAIRDMTTQPPPNHFQRSLKTFGPPARPFVPVVPRGRLPFPFNPVTPLTFSFLMPDLVWRTSALFPCLAASSSASPSASSSASPAASSSPSTISSTTTPGFGGVS
ncbi:3-phytase [Hortaea werneckii]|nr:3-phytase [Hortaea werneckii]